MHGAIRDNFYIQQYCLTPSVLSQFPVMLFLPSADRFLSSFSVLSKLVI
jgi:hypothetical protein